MKTATARLIEKFQCPKCQGRQVVSREVSLGSVAERLSPGGSPGRYLLVSCALCGFTEAYNLWVIETAAAPKKSEKQAREPAR